MPRILVVDDELDVREFSRSFFQKRGISVDMASNGVEAIQIIEKDPPDLVLLDVRMEGLSGLDVLRELQRKSLKINVLMVSGMEDQEVVEEASRLGCMGFIHKPLELGELQRVVLSILK